MRLLAIGLLAGFFSALFGVGGGVVVVPLLLAIGFSERPAMATSLAAISVVAVVGTISYALHGEVKPGAAALIGIPAALGAVGGATLQQRVASRRLSLLFALVLTAIGVRLIVWA